MRLIRSLGVVALAVLLCATPPARAQEEQPPLEDVTLRGRVLRPDGSALANTPLRVDAQSGFSFFGVFAFAFTGGLSALSCFSGPNELCPVSGGKRYYGTTDANGRYSFTFPDAHRRGEQTNTDYVLSIGMASLARPGNVVVASYELELIDAIHEAPDLSMWDTAAKIQPRERSFALEYDPRRKGGTSVDVRIGERDAPVRVSDDGSIAARDIEDVAVQLVPRAFEDVTSAGTIYHQRFTAAAVPLKGPLVPLSRRAPCTVKRVDGAAVAGCAYTDGDLVTTAANDRTPCSYDEAGNVFPRGFPCTPPIGEVTIDLGAPKEVGEVRTRCGCAVTGSLDGAAWQNLPTDGVLGAPQSVRYVRVTSDSSTLGTSPEISVWPPWEDQTTALADPAVTPLAPPGSGDGSTGGDGGGDVAGVPWPVALLALVALIGVAHATINRVQRARREGKLFA